MWDIYVRCRSAVGPPPTVVSNIQICGLRITNVECGPIFFTGLCDDPPPFQWWFAVVADYRGLCGDDRHRGMADITVDV